MTTTYTPSDTLHATADEFDDGDPPTTGAINPLPEAAFDTATWAANRVGTYRLLACLQYELTGSPIKAWSSASYAADPSTGDVFVASINGVLEDDLFELEGLLSIDKTTAVVFPAALRFTIKEASDPWDPLLLSEAKHHCASVNTYQRIALKAVHEVTTPGTFKIHLSGNSGNAGETLGLLEPSTVVVKWWRKNT